MLIEALQPLTVRLPQGEVRLVPGHPTEIPSPHAERLLAKAGDKVRALHGKHQWIAWVSPLFGECTGRVVFGPEEGWVCVIAHSVTGNLALVRSDWITRRWTE
jgi:hypothetical protein